MSVDPDKPEIVSGCREADDLVGKRSGLWLWCLPTLLFIVGLNWETVRPWLWIPALLVMRIGCALNAKRCGGLHCYITGPIFLLAAVYVILAERNIVPLRPNLFAIVVLGVSALACFAEFPFGRYVSRT